MVFAVVNQPPPVLPATKIVMCSLMAVRTCLAVLATPPLKISALAVFAILWIVFLPISVPTTTGSVEHCKMDVPPCLAVLAHPGKLVPTTPVWPFLHCNCD